MKDTKRVIGILALLIVTVLTLAVAGCVGNVSSDELENAYGEYQAGNYETAFLKFQELANRGNATAMTWLASCYYSGDGVAADRAKAFEWYQKAANNGDSEAMILVGDYYRYDGTGVAKDLVKAIEWYRKAVDAGNAYAMYVIGSCYAGGDGVAKDLVKAFEWYQKAADAGDVNAMIQLGLAYNSGEVVPKDDVKAFEWYQKSVESDSIFPYKGLYILSECYKYGIGTEIDLVKSEEMMAKLPDYWKEFLPNEGHVKQFESLIKNYISN